MVALVAGGLAQLVDDLRIGHVGRIAHAQVDDVDAGPTFAVFQVVDFAEEVRRQPLDAVGDVDLKGRLRGIRFALHDERRPTDPVWCGPRRTANPLRIAPPAVRVSAPLEIAACAAPYAGRPIALAIRPNNPTRGAAEAVSSALTPWLNSRLTTWSRSFTTRERRAPKLSTVCRR